MQKISGKIKDISSVVVKGNTVHVMTLYKQERQYMEWDDEIYDVVFVASSESTSEELSDLTLQVIGLEKRQSVIVEVDFEGEIPVAASRTANRQVRVISIERVNEKRGRREL